MIEGTICCSCNLKKATRYWVGGQPLCDDCFDEWSDKHDRDTLCRNGIKEVEKKEKEEKKSLKNWFE